MKTRLKKLLVWLAALVLAADILAPAAEVLALENTAAPPVEIPAKMTVYVSDDSPYVHYDLNLMPLKQKALKNIKSSKPKVAEASKNPDNPCAILDIIPKKPGKTKITFDLKYKKKTYHYKCVVTVKKYENPFKSLKIGTKDLKKTLDAPGLSQALNIHVPLKKTLKNKKFTFKLKKGWSFEEGILNNLTEWVSVAKGDKITVKKGFELDILLSHTSGHKQWIYFFFE